MKTKKESVIHVILVVLCGLLCLLAVNRSYMFIAGILCLLFVIGIIDAIID